MSHKVVIIGAVALGPKVACRLRRLSPTAEIVLLDRDSRVSYGGCGIPYYIGGDITDVEDLCKTSAHTLRNADFFHSSKGITLLTETEALAINRKEQCVSIKDLRSGHCSSLDYDTLVLATGAEPIIPPIPGNDLQGVFTVANLHEAEKIKNRMIKGLVSSAVVIGAGAIGIELCEAMADLWGITTTLIEREDTILPTLLSEDIALIACRHLQEKGIHIRLKESVLQIAKEETGKLMISTTGASLSCDMVILATGVRANTHLAAEAGLALGRSGGILVDSRMRTTDPHIYAGGDCIEIRNLVSGENMPMALGSLANRQGRIIANNIAGHGSHFHGATGTFCIKIFDLGIAKAGLTEKQARQAGFEPVTAVVSQPDHAHFYPGFNFIFIALTADAESRRILGIEAAGANGDAVKARVDAVAALLSTQATVEEICDLEVGYAPPFASAMDAINNAANTLDNILANQNKPITALQFIEIFSMGKLTVLDVREEKEARFFITKYGSRWRNIPLEQLRDRVHELDITDEFCLICGTGARSYEAQCILNAAGILGTCNIQGGIAMIRIIAPSFFPDSM